jgi:hypothetical protein
MYRGGLFVSTATWLDEFNFSAASVATPIRPAELVLSFGTRLLYSGNLDGYDAAGQLVEKENFYDLALTAGLSKRFDRLGLALGGDVTYIREHLPSAEGSGFTYSLGATYQFGRNRFTVSAENLGGKVSFPGRDYAIEGRVVVGYGRMVKSRLGTLNLGAEISTVQSEYERFRVGGTYSVNRYLSISGGLDHNVRTSQPDPPFSAGLGVHFDRFALDYAYTSQEYFSSTHTVSVAMSFGESESSSDPTAHRPPASTTDRTPSNRAAPENEPGQGSFAVVAGRHLRLESASAEVRALRLLKVPAVVQTTPRGSYRVVVARCDTLAEAQAALIEFEKLGHRFTIISGSE